MSAADERRKLEREVAEKTEALRMLRIAEVRELARRRSDLRDELEQVEQRLAEFTAYAGLVERCQWDSGGYSCRLPADHVGQHKIAGES